MKPRRIYFRKKGKAIILEGRMANGKPVAIWTLPEANKFILSIIANATFLPKEKRDQIREKYLRLDYKTERRTRGPSKVLTRNIVRTSNNVAKLPAIDFWGS